MVLKKIIVPIYSDYIELQQLLKVVDLISSGGQAKKFLVENNILIDGIKEVRRGKKIYPNTTVTINNIDYQIIKK